MAIQQLIERRVPHYLVAYIGIGWGVVQFIDFLERYGISPHWTDLSLLALVLLLPSVLLFTYNHGRPGKDSLTRSDLIAIPLNVALAGVALVVVFSGKDFGGTTRSIHLLDDSGKEVERVVANPSYHKRLALFDFDVAGGDTAVTWLRYGLPLGLYADLAQNMFIDVQPSALFKERLLQLQLKPDMNVPLALKRQLAEEKHIPFFTDANVTRSGDQVTVNLGLYESAQGSQVGQYTFKGSDIFALIDQMTVALRKDLDLPETKAVKDLRVTDVLTASVPAFRDMTDAIVEIQVHDRWPAALPKLEKAVATDPQFAQAQLTLHSAYLLSNQGAKSMGPLQKALDFEYRLPERQRYDLRAEYFLMKQDKEKAFDVATMKVQVFPEDLSSYGLLAQFQKMRNDKPGLIESYKKILELDPSQQGMVQAIGAQYEGLAQFDSALHYYGRYAELFPGKKEAFVSMAGVHRLRGEAEQARANYNKALSNSPEDIPALLGLAGVSMDVGDFDSAQKQFEEAIARARTPDEKTNALDALGNYYQVRGQFSRAIGYHAQALAESRKTTPPMMVDMKQLNSLGAYVRAGRTAEANRILKDVSARLQPPFTLFGPLGEMEIALELRQVDAAERAIAGVDQSIKVLGFDVLKTAVARGRARLAELKGNCEEALKYREEQLKLEPTTISVHTEMGRCYRTLGQPDNASKHAEMTLKVRPFEPRANYEMALISIALGDRAKAIEHLKRAVDVWRDADPSYTVAAEAKAKLRELETK